VLSVNILTAFKHHSNTIQTPFKRHSNGIQTAFKRHSNGIQTAFKRHSNIKIICLTLEYQKKAIYLQYPKIQNYDYKDFFYNK